MHEAIQEAQDKNIDAYLGLTDSIIGIIKCFPISEQEPTTQVEKLAHRSLATVSMYIVITIAINILIMTIRQKNCYEE